MSPAKATPERVNESTIVINRRFIDILLKDWGCKVSYIKNIEQHPEIPCKL